MAQQLGLLVWTLLMPLFFMGIVWCIQLILTQDNARARAAALSRRTIIISLALWLLVMVSRFANTFS